MAGEPPLIALRREENVNKVSPIYTEAIILWLNIYRWTKITESSIGIIYNVSFFLIFPQWKKADINNFAIKMFYLQFEVDVMIINGFLI